MTMVSSRTRRDPQRPRRRTDGLAWEGAADAVQGRLVAEGDLDREGVARLATVHGQDLRGHHIIRAEVAGLATPRR